MENNKQFNQEQALGYYSYVKKEWLFYFVGVAGFILLFLIGSIAGSISGNYIWSLLTVPGLIVMALPAFLKILKGASAKGFLDTGEMIISRIYENGTEEIDYSATNSLNAGMSVLKYGLMFLFAILLTPVALVTSTIKLIKINKAFNTAKPFLPLILDGTLVVAIIVGGIIMGATMGKDRKLTDSLKGKAEQKVALLEQTENNMLASEFWSDSSGYGLVFERKYYNAGNEYTYIVVANKNNSLKLDQGVYSYYVTSKTYGTLDANNNEVDIATIYNEAKCNDIKNKLDKVILDKYIPFNEMKENAEKVIFHNNNNVSYSIEYKSETLGKLRFDFTTNKGLDVNAKNGCISSFKWSPFSGWVTLSYDMSSQHNPFNS